MVRQVAELGLWALAACALTLINRFVGALVPLPSYPSIPAHALALLYLAALLLCLMHLARAAARLPLSTPFLLTAGALLGAPMGTVLILQQQKVFPPLWLLLTANNFFLPIAAALVGAGIGRVIRHPNTLLAGAGFAIFFDIVVVTMGTVAQLMKSGSNVIAAVSVGAGSVPSGMPDVKTYPLVSGVTIGPADVLFLALFLSAVYAMRLSRRSTFAWMYVLLMLALVIVETIGLPIPALVPMGIAVLIANARHGAFTRAEKYALAYGGAFAILCAALIIYGSRRLVPPGPPDYGWQIARAGEGGPLVVMQIKPDSIAAKAGIRQGDLIVRINNQRLRMLSNQAIAAVLDKQGKEGVRLRVRRRGEADAREITLPAPAR